jgi:Icc-related predicted phosphoesterase
MTVIAAVSDVHSPLYLHDFLLSMGLRLSEADVFLWGGDMVLKGRVSALESVLKGVRKIFGGRIIAVFGNEEYDNLKGQFMEKYPEIMWLDDSETTVEIDGRMIRVIGTKGTLGEPTSWQEKNIPNIRDIYTDRLQKVKQMLELKESNSVNLLLTHYAPASLTINGENKEAYPALMDERMEAVIRETRPNLVIHGHSHNSKVLFGNIDDTKIFNVAFPARRGITMIDI